MSRNKEFKELEKSLKKKFVNMKENEVILRDTDFENGRLTKSGYISLKQQSDYISTNEDIEIRIPTAYSKGFKDQLEYVATKELIRIKADMKYVNISALIFFIVGVSLLSLPAFILFFKKALINELILIVSWVFTWAAVEKKFFEMYRLKNRRINVLHILSSKILFY